MAAARVAGLARRRVLVWGRVSDEIAGLIEQERELYDIIPTKSALVGQLLTEAISFRWANRPPPPKPTKAAPLPPELKARLDKRTRGPAGED
jgi:hypothetical protein